MCGTLVLPNFHHQVERLPRGVSSSIGNESTAAGVRLDQALFAERLDCLAHSGAADAKTLRQLTFCGELVPGFQRAIKNRLLDLPDDLFVQTRSPDNFVHRNFPRTGQFEGTGVGLATIPQVQCLRATSFVPAVASI